MSRNPQLQLTLSSEPLRVAVVANDPLARAGLEAALQGAEGVILSDGSGPAPEVVVLDAGGDPEGPDADALARVIDGAGAPVVVLVAEPQHASAALEAGAQGVVLRDQLAPSLLAALSAARQGLTVLDQKMAPRGARPSRTALPEPLTPRETQVLTLMTDGLSNKQIAGDLGISQHTAKFHIGSILDKLDADTRTGAVVTAVRLGLVEL